MPSLIARYHFSRPREVLVDQNRSPRLAQLLRGAGHDAVHTLERGLEHADDDVLLDVARDEQRIVISGDTDFGALLALTRRRSPSVILFPSRHHRKAQQQVAVILEHLDGLADDLATGAVGRDQRRTHPRQTTATTPQRMIERTPRREPAGPEDADRLIHG